MKNNKGIVPIFIVLIVGVVVILAGGVGYYLVKKEKVPIVQEQQLIGGDKDEYGCIGSAGYSWCEIKQKCLRIWEEECEKEIVSTINSTTTLFRIDGWKLYSDNENYFELQYPPFSNYTEVKPEMEISVKRIIFSNMSMGPGCPGLNTFLDVVPNAKKNLPKLIPNTYTTSKNGLKVYNYFSSDPYTQTYAILLPNNIGLIYVIGGDCPLPETTDAINLIGTIIPIK